MLDTGRQKQKDTVSQHIHPVAKETFQRYIEINTTPVHLTRERGILFLDKPLASLDHHQIPPLISFNLWRWDFTLVNKWSSLISYGLDWFCFLCVCACVRSHRQDILAKQRKELFWLLQWHTPGRRHVDVNIWGEVMRGSDYVKLLMDLEGIVIKVSTFSLEQFGKGMFHTL